MANGTEIIGFSLFTVGAYLSWFAIHYWRDADPWPSSPVKALLRGDAFPVPSRVPRAGKIKEAEELNLSDELSGLTAAQTSAVAAASFEPASSSVSVSAADVKAGTGVNSALPASALAPNTASDGGPGPTGVDQTPTGANQLAWSEAILNAIPAPLTTANIESIGYWMQNESGTGNAPNGLDGVAPNNPLNGSQAGTGSSSVGQEAPGVDLMSYATAADGAMALGQMIATNGAMAPMKAALVAGSGLTGVSASAISNYSGGGYSSIPDSWGESQGIPALPVSATVAEQ